MPKLMWKLIISGNEAIMILGLNDPFVSTDEATLRNNGFYVCRNPEVNNWFLPTANTQQKGFMYACNIANLEASSNNFHEWKSSNCMTDTQTERSRYSKLDPTELMTSPTSNANQGG